MDAAMAVGGGGASPWRGNDEVDEQREKPTVPLSPKPSPTSSYHPPLSDPTNVVPYNATTVAVGGGGGGASPWRGKGKGGEKGEKPTLPASPSSYSSNANTSATAVKEPSPAGRFAVVAKPEQAETRFSAGSAPVVSKLEAGGGGGGGRTSGRPGEDRTRGVLPPTARWRRERLLGRAELVLRVLAFLFSLISFSVMASDKTQGWSGDSYNRYKQYRYVVGVNVIVFVYSGFQVLAYVYQFAAGSLIIRHFTICLGFAADQILAYLLMSASSSAASLTEDTQALWGKDPFTNKAGGSVAISFLAFTALALSALTSGYHMYNSL